MREQVLFKRFKMGERKVLRQRTWAKRGFVWCLQRNCNTILIFASFSFSFVFCIHWNRQGYTSWHSRYQTDVSLGQAFHSLLRTRNLTLVFPLTRFWILCSNGKGFKSFTGIQNPPPLFSGIEAGKLSLTAVACQLYLPFKRKGSTISESFEYFLRNFVFHQCWFRHHGPWLIQRDWTDE